MQRKRLETLRDALIEHAKNPRNLFFNLNSWAKLPTKYFGSDPLTAVRGASLGKNFCGTSACAMGLAASLPEFNRCGLTLEGGLTCPGVTFNLGNGREHYGFIAAAEFFNIDASDAMELFHPGKYRRDDRKNPLVVAEKITALLECER